MYAIFTLTDAGGDASCLVEFCDFFCCIISSSRVVMNEFLFTDVCFVSKECTFCLVVRSIGRKIHSR